MQDLKGRIQRLPNFQRNVVSVRRQLMGMTTLPEQKRYIKPHDIEFCFSLKWEIKCLNDNNTNLLSVSSLSESNLLEAAIVLEEFCKVRFQ